ncbi:Sfh5p KNAG_0C02570 [Huiozyma naganishii CBS 8797]|uniref:Phosphatidylinositol transfer protein SFH5 n=1 Tax=Huiozyma naganishii (strain ATCC MYA-139 / BCRC 22969 / CBS 8797 / KCTC 17520 / NBRC 10181 / NCYC 3082 / Yp74L-3) TaxID=1071383 RepID=J7RIL7_HUIN7|nr:hypothetical protein KNAG_0C02570 [Kazachstania naganishii CBS 8797]CCK69368.1 hypothetical protein KNAG_0C02570 [Kazachstania naganishii CBS 8797]
MKFSTDAEKQTFDKLVKNLPGIVKDKCDGYDELYGYKLVSEGAGSEFYNKDVADALVFKLCKAYQFQYEDIMQHLIHILKWRKEFNPLSSAFQEVHDKDLQEIGFLTFLKENDPNTRAITWNLYGELLKKKELLNDLDKFIRYRIGLMERGLRLVDFTDESDNYMTQVHDYKGVSLWRMDPKMKACVKQVISIFQESYPELLYAKYFVNVPTVLGWVYDVIKKFVDPETRKKFVVLTDGNKLGQYLAGAPSKQYGGKNKKTLAELNMTDIRPTDYGLFMLEQLANVDLD